MKFLTLYLAAGLFVLAIVLLQHYLEKKRSGPSPAELLRELQNQDKSNWIEAGQEAVVMTVAGLATVAFWPVAIFFVIKQWISNRRDEKRREQAKFRITAQDLVEELSINEIEQRERVDDPQGAVPDLPFGHLNESWSKFREGLNSNDVLWSFRAMHESLWGSTVEKAGYVAVDGDKIGSYFLTIEKVVSAG